MMPTVPTQPPGTDGSDGTTGTLAASPSVQLPATPAQGDELPANVRPLHGPSRALPDTEVH